MPWGYHLIIDGITTVDPTLLDSYLYLKGFINDMVEGLDMKKLGGIHAEYLHTKDPELKGWSLVQLINTSSITVHACTETGKVFIDIFSCKVFSQDAVKDIIRKYFNFHTVTYNFMQRGTWRDVSPLDRKTH